MTTETGFLDVHGGKLYYEVAGSGDALVFIHAGVANCTMWDNQMAYFAPQYRVVRYDTRGFGRTTSQAVECSNRQDLLDLLNHVGIDKAILIGNSRGGMIALDTALEFPDRVAGIVMLGSGPGGFEMEPTPDPDNEAMMAQWQQFMDAKDWEAIASMEADYWVNGPKQPHDRVPAHLYEYVRSMILESYTREQVEITAIELDPPAWQRRAAINVPLLIMIGTLDEAYCVVGSKALAEAVPHAQLSEYENVAHMVSLEQPDRFNREVEQFVEEVNGKR